MDLGKRSKTLRLQVRRSLLLRKSRTRLPNTRRRRGVTVVDLSGLVPPPRYAPIAPGARSMNRRTFSRSLAGAAVTAALPAFRGAAKAAEQSAAPYQSSVMLWTVFKNLPFEHRLEKVAEA